MSAKIFSLAIPLASLRKQKPTPPLGLLRVTLNLRPSKPYGFLRPQRLVRGIAGEKKIENEK